MKNNDELRPIYSFGLTNIGCDQSGATFQTIVSDPNRGMSDVPGAQPVTAAAGEEHAEDPCFFIHPKVATEAERWQIHREIVQLVSHHQMPDICAHLNDMAAQGKILLPLSPDSALSELHRLGMPGPDTSGYSYKNFCKYYRKGG